MSNDKEISYAVIRRLPRYYRYLCELQEKGISRISSSELSDKMNLTASQIRQDLSNFGSFGLQGYGYNVDYLQQEIKNILGMNKIYKLVIIGAGNIGQALACYTNFEKRGFQFIALFDINPKLIGMTIRGIPVYDIDDLEKFAENNHVDIAVLALPKENAVKVAKTVVASGIKGIWNFSHVDLEVPENVEVENVHLTDSLILLSYKLDSKNEPTHQ